MIRPGAPKPAALKSYVARIEAELTKIDSIKDVISGIYDEAKGGRVVPKILRKVVARRRAKDQAKLLQEDDLLDAYLSALDAPTARAVEMAAQGASAREIEAATGIDQATVARSVSLKNKRETPPHNPETGEINDTDGRSEPANGVSAVDVEAHARSRGGDEGRAETLRLRDGQVEGRQEGDCGQATPTASVATLIETGEITNAVPLGDDQASNGLPANADESAEPPQPGSDGRVSSAGTTESCGDGDARPQAAGPMSGESGHSARSDIAEPVPEVAPGPQDLTPITEAVNAGPPSGSVEPDISSAKGSAPADTRTWDEIVGERPDFLTRRPEART
ncbi:MAG: GapR family DNA-binding domain-containing protein [Acidobacteriota bacterium]